MTNQICIDLQPPGNTEHGVAGTVQSGRIQREEEAALGGDRDADTDSFPVHASGRGTQSLGKTAATKQRTASVIRQRRIGS